jgi:hypothetical protein
MAGQLKVGTLDSTVSNTPTIFNANGTQVGTLCRAWIYFGYDGATTNNYASFNVSSLTRTGTGNYTINFTNALNDANYAPIISTGTYSSTAGIGGGVTMPSPTGTPTDKTTSS